MKTLYCLYDIFIRKIKKTYITTLICKNIHEDINNIHKEFEKIWTFICELYDSFH